MEELFVLKNPRKSPVGLRQTCSYRLITPLNSESMFHFFPRLDSGFLLASLQTKMNPLCIWSLTYVSCLLRLLDLCEDYFKMSARNKNRSWRTDQSCICLRARKASSFASWHAQACNLPTGWIPLNFASSTVSRLRPFKHSRSFRYFWSRPPSLHPPMGWVPGTTPPSLLFASYWRHFWGPASYLLSLCSISDYQPRIY